MQGRTGYRRQADLAEGERSEHAGAQGSFGLVSRLEVDDRYYSEKQARTSGQRKDEVEEGERWALIAGRKEQSSTSRLRTSRINTSATGYNACLPEDKRPKLKSPGRGRGPYIRKLQVRTDQVAVSVTSHCVQLAGWALKARETPRPPRWRRLLQCTYAKISKIVTIPPS